MSRTESEFSGFMDINNDNDYMELALAHAEKAGQRGEIPIGAVLVASNGQVLAAAHNQPVTLSDPTAHAEILVLRASGKKIENYRILDSTLYVTIEPCVMCMGAIIHARLKRLVFGAPDPKWGAAGSLFDLTNDDRLNHRIQVVGGILAPRCKKLMQDFFRQRR